MTYSYDRRTAARKPTKELSKDQKLQKIRDFSEANIHYQTPNSYAEAVLKWLDKNDQPLDEASVQAALEDLELWLDEDADEDTPVPKGVRRLS